MSITQLRKILFSTGNILDNEELVRKVGQSTSEELRSSVKSTLNSWTNNNEVTDGGVLRINPNTNRTTLSNGVKTTVKFFLSSCDGNKLEDAINTLVADLSVWFIHTVIIAPPDVSDDLTLEMLMPLWQALEAAVENKVVTTIGISDISTELFKELYEWAKIKPSTIQLNVSSCCTVPEELSEYAKLHDVQVLTHNDSQDILDEDVVDNILSRVGLSGVQCEVIWLARYRFIQTCYGLVLDKGYGLALSCGEPS